MYKLEIREPGPVNRVQMDKLREGVLAVIDDPMAIDDPAAKDTNGHLVVNQGMGQVVDLTEPKDGGWDDGSEFMCRILKPGIVVTLTVMG